MQRPRQPLRTQRHHHLDQTRNTSSSLRMADVRLHRAQPQGLVLGPRLTIRRQQRLRLDRVTQSRPRAVRLNDVHLRRREPRRRQRLADHTLLRRTIRRRQPIRRTVLVDRAPTYDRQHLMPQAPRVGQPLQHHHPGTLGPPRTVRTVRERLTTAVRGQTPLPRKLNERRRSRHDGDTTGQRHPTLPRTQRLTRPMQGHQRRRTRRIHRHRGPLEPEDVRDAAGEDAARVPVPEKALDFLRSDLQPRRIVVVHQPREHTRRRTTQRQRVNPGPLQRLPRRLQQQPLLRIHRKGLTRRNAEQLRIELGRVMQETAFPRVRGARTIRVRVEQGLEVPATVGREPGDPVAGRVDQLPQGLGGRHTARVAAAHPHDRDRLMVLRLRFSQTLTGLAEVGGETLEVRQRLLVSGHVSPAPLSRVRVPS